jgi:hypothetical protein
MSGASAIYLEQGHDQFFKPGPGEHPFQLNPLGRITEEFIRFAEKHPDRGTPYTPIAFLLEPAHGFEMTDYPQWPFEVSPIDRSDRALRELFGVAYYPGLVVEGEPAIADRQPFVAGVFGDIFDVLTTNATNFGGYRAVVLGGRATWNSGLTDYVRNGGLVLLNGTQSINVPENLLGIRRANATAEADSARCLSPGEEAQDLSGQLFSYEKIELKGATTLIAAPNGDPLVTVNKVGKGSVVFAALPDLLGADERITPFAAHMLAHVFADATPVQVLGDVEYLINRTKDAWVVTLLNSNGVYKSQQGMAQVDRTAYVNVLISLRGSLQGEKILSAVDWINDAALKVQSDQISVRIAPGGVAIIELKTK